MSDLLFELTDDVDTIPKVSDPICSYGDVWQLGNHRIICGDSTNENDINKLLGNNIIDMVLTDPPYKYNDYSKGNKGFDENDNYIKFVKSISNGFDVEKTFSLWAKYLNKTNIYCFTSNDFVPDIMNYGLENKKQTYLLVWKKGGRPFGVTYLHDVEFIIHIKETGAIYNGAYKSRVSECMSKRLHGHPTEKPVELLKQFLFYGSDENSIVFDGFLGSGSTLIACERAKRKCYGIEIEPYYCDVVINRWQKMTCKKAIKIGV